MSLPWCFKHRQPESLAVFEPASISAIQGSAQLEKSEVDRILAFHVGPVDSESAKLTGHFTDPQSSPMIEQDARSTSNFGSRRFFKVPARSSGTSSDRADKSVRLP
jgi:hypothetical protein